MFSSLWTADGNEMEVNEIMVRLPVEAKVSDGSSKSELTR